MQTLSQSSRPAPTGAAYTKLRWAIATMRLLSLGFLASVLWRIQDWWLDGARVVRALGYWYGKDLSGMQAWQRYTSMGLDLLDWGLVVVAVVYCWRFSPTDLVATALSTCMLTVMGIVADRHGWSLEGCGARVEKTMTSEPPRRIALLSVWVTLPPGLGEQQRSVLRRAAEACPVKRSLEGAVPMELHWS